MFIKRLSDSCFIGPSLLFIFFYPFLPYLLSATWPCSVSTLRISRSHSGSHKRSPFSPLCVLLNTHSASYTPDFQITIWTLLNSRFHFEKRAQSLNRILTLNKTETVYIPKTHNTLDIAPFTSKLCKSLGNRSSTFYKYFPNIYEKDKMIFLKSICDYKRQKCF